MSTSKYPIESALPPSIPFPFNQAVRMKTPMLVAGVERETNSLATLVRASPLRFGLGSPARPNVRYPSSVRSENLTPENIEIAITTAELRISPRAAHFKTDLGSWYSL